MAGLSLHVFHDESGWGLWLHATAKARGIRSVLFRSADELADESGYVFVRMHHAEPRRTRDKALVAQLTERGGLIVIPDARSAELYDDKVAQAKALKQWLPPTLILRKPGAVPRSIERLGLPLVSKSACGAASHNVRLIETSKDAWREARCAFGNGLPVHDDERQEGYLLWQKFCEGNGYDYRVIVVGRSTRLMLRRRNREDRPFASGSGLIEPIAHLDDEAAEVLAFANEIAAAEKFLWAGFDILRDGSKWRMTETTVAWTAPAYFDCRFLDRDRNGAQIFDVLIDAIEQGEFEPQS